MNRRVLWVMKHCPGCQERRPVHVETQYCQGCARYLFLLPHWWRPHGGGPRDSPPPPEVDPLREERIRRYTQRAALELPLFEEDGHDAATA